MKKRLGRNKNCLLETFRKSHTGDGVDAYPLPPTSCVSILPLRLVKNFYWPKLARNRSSQSNLSTVSHFPSRVQRPVTTKLAPNKKKSPFGTLQSSRHYQIAVIIPLFSLLKIYVFSTPRFSAIDFYLYCCLCPRDCSNQRVCDMHQRALRFSRDGNLLPVSD
jgi:hypothetical protein